MRYATLVKNGTIERDGGWLMDVDMTGWSTAADLAAKAGYCPDGSVGEIGVARMAEAEKAAAEWAEAVQRLKSMTRGKEKRHDTLSAGNVAS